MPSNAVFDLILALTGGGLLTITSLGLAMGGNLPFIRFPDRIKPAVKLLYVVGLVVGLTLLLDKGHPDILDRVARELASAG